MVEVEARDVVMRMVEDFSLLSESDSEEEDVVKRELPKVVFETDSYLSMINVHFTRLRSWSQSLFSLHLPPQCYLNPPPFNSMTGV